MNKVYNIFPPYCSMDQTWMTTDKLIHLGLETLCLELELNGQLLSHGWHSLHQLVTPTWLSHTWQFQTEYNI